MSELAKALKTIMRPVFGKSPAVIPDDCLRAMANVPVRRTEIPNRLLGATILENGDVT